jgi:bifunctional DNase/RNase
MSLVECELTRVVMTETRHHQAIVLKEKNGQREMAIMIGLAEAFALHRTVNEEPPPRPLTHELFGSVLDELDVRIDRIVVNDLSEGVYYGRLILSRDGDTFNIDSRPSDAIVLASQKRAPIFVDEAVLDEASRQF